MESHYGGQDIRKRAFEFALNVIKIYRCLNEKPEGRILGNQLLRSATSIGANLEEADGACSKADFRAKIFIALKEARETLYWLKLIDAAHILSTGTLGQLIDECDQLIRILKTISKPR
jgi:four helix bundle protein